MPLFLLSAALAYFGLHFLKATLTPVTSYFLHRKRFAHLPKHPEGNVGLKLLDASRDYESNMPFFQKVKETGEQFDLVDVGPGT